VPKKSYIIKDFSGGYNLFKHTSSLEDNESPLMINVRGDKKGKLRAAHSILAAGSSLFTDIYISPSQGLFASRFDYGIEEELQFQGFNVVTQVTLTPGDSTAIVGATAGVGVEYGNGGANFQNHAVQFDITAASFKPARWYVFRLVIINKSRATTVGWPGWLEAHINDQNPVDVTSQMFPAEYRTKAAGTQSGIAIRNNERNASPVGFCNTVTCDRYTTIVNFMIKTPNAFTGGASNTSKFWLTGHPNGTTTGAGADDYILSSLGVSALPYDVDKDVAQNYSDVRSLMHLNAGKVHIVHDDLYVAREVAYTKVRSYDNSDGTSSAGVASGESSDATLHQSGQIARLSEGNFRDIQNSETKSIGYVVNELSEVLGGHGSSILTGDATETVERDKYPYIKYPMKRTFIARAQDPQSALPQSSFGKVENLGRPLVCYENTSNVTLDDMLKTISNGKTGISITKPSANGTPMKDEWRKVWKFGIAYKLRDGSYTNVVDAGTGLFAGETGKVINMHVTDSQFDSLRVDSTNFTEDRTITMAASADPTDYSMYIKNGVLHGLASKVGEVADDATQLEAFTIAAAEFAGGATGASGVCYVSNAHIDYELDLTDATAWPENPRFELFFKEDSQEARSYDSGIVVGATNFDAWAPWCLNDEPNGSRYHNYLTTGGEKSLCGTATTLGGYSNFRDARVNGMVIFMYSDTDLSADEDIPWQPLFEVDLDLKRYKNWAYDKRWYDLEPNSKHCSLYVESGCGYTSSTDFSHDGTKNCEEVPSAYTMTYSDLIPYRSNENTKVRWGSSCMVNGRAVIGNVKLNGTIYNDRIMVSAPGTIDVFAEDYAWDAGSSDGQKIITIAAFGDKVLVFKEQDMYIMNFTDPNNFFIEAQYHYYGVNNPGSVCRSDYGITWVAPRYGIMHYDGSSITDLTEEKLTIENMCRDMSNQDSTLRGIRSSDVPSISFEPKSRTLLVLMDTYHNYTGLWTGNYSELAWSYDFNSKDWSLMDKFQYNSSNKKTFTNFIDIGNGKLFTIKSDITGSAYPHLNGLTVPYEVNPSGTIAYGSTHIPQFWTREIDFGDMGSNKHVYKVVVKYKKSCNATGPQTGFRVQAAVNGNYDSLRNMTTTLSTDGWMNNSTDSWTVQEFKPETLSEFKNIKTIAVTLTASATSSVYEGFVIDSISLVYRIKSVVRETF